MKVRIFDESHELDLENSVNKFIESEEVKEVVDIKYSISNALFSSEQIYCFSALIMYK